MRRFIESLVRICVLLAICSTVLADEGLPWYANTCELEKVWNISQGNGVVVIVLDTPIHFISALKNKAHGESYAEKAKLKHYTYREWEQKYSDEQNYSAYIHGTAIAAIISGEKTTIRNENDVNEELVVLGIAPSVSISEIEWGNPFLVSNGLASQTISEALQAIVQKVALVRSSLPGQTPSGSATHPDVFYRKDQKLISVNVSGGTTQDPPPFDIGEWRTTLAKDEKTLIIASVGNSRKDLNKGSNAKARLFPAGLKPPSNKKLNDPIFRVGALAEYKHGDVPSIYHSSNVGDCCVDILAPGSNMAVLTPSGYAIISGGTSEAAAIVTGTAALMVSCNPYATAREIQEAILDYADKHVSLDDKSKNGAVINILNAVDNFCYEDNDDEQVFGDKKDIIDSQINCSALATWVTAVAVVVGGVIIYRCCL